MGFSRQEYWSRLLFPSPVSDKVVKAKSLFPLMIMKPSLFQEFTSFSLNFFPVFLWLLISIFSGSFIPPRDHVSVSISDEWTGRPSLACQVQNCFPKSVSCCSLPLCFSILGSCDHGTHRRPGISPDPKCLLGVNMFFFFFLTCFI